MVEIIVAAAAIGAVVFGFYYKFKVQKGGCGCGCDGCSPESKEKCGSCNS